MRVTRIKSYFLLVLFILLCSATAAQAVDPVITGYELTDRTRVSRTDYQYTYKAVAQNSGTDDYTDVSAVLTSSVSTTVVVDDSLTFGDISSGQSVQSSDTFSIRVNRRYSFDETALTWTFSYETVTDPGDTGTPDPKDVAPQFKMTATTGFMDGIAFLYTGANPIQTGVAEDTIVEKRAAVIRGMVKDNTGSPIKDVIVTVLNHGEYGQTLTRADGEYDLAVNGGGTFTLNFFKSGYLTSQRTVVPDWQDYTVVNDVVLVAVTGEIHTISFGTGSELQTILGKYESDDDGDRKAILLVPGGTSATLHYPDGTEQALANAHMSITEYTVGDLGPEAMPADLPASSAYTYAAEFLVEEVAARGATSVTFDQPLYGYIQNFLGFPTGTPVPAAYYDRTTGAWIPTADGRVIEILSITEGVAQIDANGDGTVDNGIFNADTADDGIVEIDLGMTTEERRELAANFPAGQTIWRVPVQHLSPHDWNFPYYLTSLSGSDKPTMPHPSHGTTPTDTPKKIDDYGIIEVENQIFRESLGLTGTPFTINYSSGRVDGNKSAATLSIPLTGSTLPSGPLKDVKVTISVAGQRHVYSVVDSAQGISTNMTYSYTWDGLDAYGRKVPGEVPVTVDLSYVYEGYYSIPRTYAGWYSFSLPGYDQDTILIPTREDFYQTQTFETTFDASQLWYAKEQALGGWTIDAHHAYDPNGRTLYRGDGAQYSAVNYGVGVLERLAGTNTSLEATGDGGPALEGTIEDFLSVAVASDGAIYFSDTNTIRKIDPDGIITTVAGQAYSGYDGDGGPAENASFAGPFGLAFGPDDSLYIADTDNGVVRKINPGGIITTVAGDPDFEFAQNNAVPDFNICLVFQQPKKFLQWVAAKIESVFHIKEAIAAFAQTDYGDGRPATEAYLESPTAVVVDKDGSLYIGEYCKIRKVATNGIITTYAGSDVGGSSDDNIPATDASIPQMQSMAIGPDGSVYYTQVGWLPNQHLVRRIYPDGIVTTIAGGGTYQNPDGQPATEALLDYPENLAVTDDGSVYFSDTSSRVFKINTRGIILTVAGGGATPFSEAEGAQAPAIDFSEFYLRPALNPDGELIICAGYVPPWGTTSLSDLYNSVWKLKENSLPERSGDADIVIPARNGMGLYIFDAGGRHLETRNALTGAVTLSFGYDSDGRLITVTDADNNVTAVNRDGSGNPTSVTAPAGQTTTVNVDANDYLETITNPAGQTVTFDYTSGGLLTSMFRPKGNEYTFEYDSIGRLIRADKPDGSFDTLTRKSLNDDNSSSYEVVKTNSLGHQTTYRTEYLEDGDVQKTVIQPDGLQNLTLQRTDGSEEHTSPDGVVTSITRLPSPRFGMLVPVISNVTVTTPDGIETIVESTRETTLSDASDLTSVTSLINTTTVNGRTFTESYDGFTRQYTRTTPTGRTSTMTIDEVGRIIESQTSSFEAAVYAYDSDDGQLSSVTQGARFVQYGYDEFNNLNSITNVMGASETLSHTASGKIDVHTNALGNTVGFDYGLNGKVTGVTTPRGHLHQYGYNPVDMMESYTDPSGNSAAYEYDGEQNTTQITLAGNKTMTFGYDSMGRTTSITDPSGVVTTSTFDAVGRLSAIERAGEKVEYSYDGHLPVQTDISGSVAQRIGVIYNNNIRRESVTIDGETVNYTYDDDGLVTQAGELIISRNTEDGLIHSLTLGQTTVDFNYNAYSEQTACTVSHSGTTMFSQNYRWNDLGQITEKQEFYDSTTNTYEYAYDLIGQLTGVEKDDSLVEAYSYDANHNRNPSDATYDNQDRLISDGGTSYAYCDNGFLTESVSTGGTTRYNYIETGELTSVSLSDGTDVTYIYDGMGRRILRDLSGLSTQKFVYLDQLSPVAELDAFNNVVSRFIYATGDNAPDYMVRNGINYLFVKDQIGSIRLVVNTSTGNVIQKIDYDAFGQVLSDSNPGFQPFGFAGGMYDPETGLVHFDRRDYDPITGRWTAKDPIRFNGGSTNLYAYANNNPVSFKDPSGLKSESTYSDIIDKADQSANYEGIVWDGAEMIAKDGFKNASAGGFFKTLGNVTGVLSAGTSFLKYVDTANAYYYDGKGSLWDVAHDFVSLGANTVGLIPLPPTQMACKALSYLDTASTPIMTAMFTQYYIQQSSNLPTAPSQAQMTGPGYGNGPKP